MRALIALVIVMGVLIVAGIGTIVVTIIHRMGNAVSALPMAANALTLQEPPGTHILQATESGGHLTTVLQGGGPDRVVVTDLATGRTLARLSLAP